MGHTLNRREVKLAELRNREVLYGDFLNDCAKLIVDAVAHTLDKPETLLGIYALLNRIRLSASAPVLTEAEHLLRRITDKYFARNHSVAEMRVLTKSQDADPLKVFAEGCRVELRYLSAHGITRRPNRDETPTLP